VSHAAAAACEAAALHDGGAVRAHASRLDLLAERASRTAAFVRRLPPLSLQAPWQAELNAGVRVHAQAGRRLAPVPLRGQPAQRSHHRVGLLYLPERAPRNAWGRVRRSAGETSGQRLDKNTSRGDVALLCSAAAEAGHSELLHALQRLPEIDRRDASRPRSPSMRSV
jgi:hypothetical protein